MDHESPQKRPSASACDVKALEACLREHNGDRAQCQQHIAAFQSACGRPSQAASPPN